MRCLIVLLLQRTVDRRGSILETLGKRELPRDLAHRNPQSKAEIEAFAAENRFVIEWRGKIPAEDAAAGKSA